MLAPGRATTGLVSLNRFVRLTQSMPPTARKHDHDLHQSMSTAKAHDLEIDLAKLSVGPRSSAARNEDFEALPGWSSQSKGNKTVWSGNCTKCGFVTNVPFRPVVGAKPPLCRTCLGQKPPLATEGGVQAMPSLARGIPSATTRLHVDALNMT
jgi:CxxC-x17-CxxC domain-containing protein